MKIGVCVSDDYEKALYAQKLGYDFIETHCQNLVKMDEETFNKFASLEIPIYSANCFIGTKIVGPKRDEKANAEYIKKLFERAKKLDLKVLVFGSSVARRTDGEVPKCEAKEQIVDFLKNYVAPQCEKTNIMVAIEPLRKEESDVINTVAQGIEIAKKVNSPYIKVLADVKHMVDGEDPVSVLPEYNNWLIHGHTSNPYPDPSLGKKRTYPAIGDEYDQGIFFNALNEAGVTHCAIEADVIDYKTDFEKSYEVLKQFKDI